MKRGYLLRFQILQTLPVVPNVLQWKYSLTRRVLYDMFPAVEHEECVVSIYHE